MPPADRTPAWVLPMAKAPKRRYLRERPPTEAASCKEMFARSVGRIGFAGFDRGGPGSALGGRFAATTTHAVASVRFAALDGGRFRCTTAPRSITTRTNSASHIELRHSRQR